jgi:hypothetical protein
MASVVVTDVRNLTRDVYPIDYGIAKITNIKSHTAKFSETLPFRVKFINIGITNPYNPNSPAPIGIEVIGMNNYIL